MKSFRFIRGALVAMGLVGMCVPSAAFAVEPVQQPVISDIALDNGGTLHGQLIDLRGGNVGNIPVSLQSQTHEVVTTTTTADGRFAAQNMKGGVYNVAAGQNQGVYRVWKSGTAPPSAQNSAIVYTQGGMKMFLANPIVVAGVVATAVAVPVALSNNNNSSP